MYYFTHRERLERMKDKGSCAGVSECLLVLTGRRWFNRHSQGSRHFLATFDTSKRASWIKKTAPDEPSPTWTDFYRTDRANEISRTADIGRTTARSSGRFSSLKVTGGSVLIFEVTRYSLLVASYFLSPLSLFAFFLVEILKL